MKKTKRRFTEGICLLPLFSILYCLGCTHVPEVHVVEMKQMQFQPAQLTVHKGDTVVFINHDLVAHNIVEASKAAWSSSLLPSGKSWRIAVNQSWNYICTIHPTMKGKLIVKQ